MKKIIALFITVLSIQRANAQTNDYLLRKQVLEKGITDSLYIFNKWDKFGKTETHLNYLGQLTTKFGATLKIMSSSWIWGISKRATNRILVFNEKNEYLGNFYLSNVDYLPDKLENGFLIFKCKKEKNNKVNFNHGIPTSFFIISKSGQGDFFKFE